MQKRLCLLFEKSYFLIFFILKLFFRGGLELFLVADGFLRE